MLSIPMLCQSIQGFAPALNAPLMWVGYRVIKKRVLGVLQTQPCDVGVKCSGLYFPAIVLVLGIGLVMSHVELYFYVY